MPQEYVALFSAKRGSELLHYGVKGMKWGVRRSNSGGRLTSTPAAAKAHAEGRVHTKTETAPHSGAQESSIAQYNRLKKQVAKKGASSLSDEELRFLNSRAEAISKANKTFHNQNSWLSKNVKSSLDAAASKLMKDVVQAAVTKHAATPLHGRLNLPPPVRPSPPTPTP